MRNHTTIYNEFIDNAAITECIQQGLDPSILSALDKNAVFYIATIAARVCYATRGITILDVIGKSIRDVQLLLSYEASEVYGRGIKADELKDFHTKELHLLMTVAARAWYHAHSNEEIRSFIRKSYEIKLQTLLHHYIAEHLNNDTDFIHSASNISIKVMEILLSDTAMSKYAAQRLQINELINLEPEQIQCAIELVGDTSHIDL
ncbi:unnamed protein product [Blepharisma stoltei]|uniref:HDOD domain-containing protein n=1 Tax=Blepharisma stoltei TaxID=1481888 RepID=A0AAU9INB7_9CILI|nr:unnamed protein product [Blepharisma stoltei]